MRTCLRYSVWLALLCTAVPAARGAVSGYAEYGIVHDDNYNMAQVPAERITETLHVFDAMLMYAQPVSRASSLLLTGGLRYAAYSRFPDLSGTTYYLNGGFYHRSSYLRAYSFLVGGYHADHRATAQNADGYSARFSPIQRLSPTYWLTEQLFYEKGDAEHLTDKYRGYGLSLRASRFIADNRSGIAATFTAARKTYDDFFRRDMTAYQLGLEWTYPIQERVYVRATGLYTLAGSHGDFDYRSRVASLVVGYAF